MSYPVAACRPQAMPIPVSGGGAFDPATLSGCQLALEFDAANVLFSDAAGTTPAVNAGNVKCWKDRSASVRHATNSGATFPTLDTTNGVVFAPNKLLTFAASMTFAANWSVYCSCRQATNGQALPLSDGNLSNGKAIYAIWSYFSAISDLRPVKYGDTPNFKGASPVTAAQRASTGNASGNLAVCVWKLIRTGSTSIAGAVKDDRGSNASTGVIASTNLVFTTMAALVGNSNFLRVFVYNRQLSGSEETSLNTYFTTKDGRGWQ